MSDTKDLPTPPERPGALGLVGNTPLVPLSRINPNPNVKVIRGIPVYHSLKEIDRPVDMVEVFRPKEELYGIAEQSIAIGAKVLWGQIGVHDDRAAKLAEDAGLKVVMNRCPKIELFRPFWKPRLDLEI